VPDIVGRIGTPPSLVILPKAKHLIFAGCSMPSYDRTLCALALW